LAKIVNPQVIEVGDHLRIDDFTFINGGNGIRIGRYVHIACFAGIIGGGELIIGDYVVIGYGARIITGTDTYHGGKRMSTAAPQEQRDPVLGKVIIEKDAFIGTNVVVHPNVRIGEGAIIGSNSLVLKDVEPWSINVGSPCRKIGERPKVMVEDV
jgi:galactoside O-acetyltransferase